MAGEFSDKEMALTLNRQQLRTVTGAGWTAKSVARIREQQHPPEFHKASATTMTLQQAAGRLQVGASVVLKLVRQGILPGRQVVGCAPWQISADAIDSEAVKKALARTLRRKV